MTSCRRLTSVDVRRMPWRNGRGVSEELAVGPAGSSLEQGDLDWRVAAADVVEGGPFSPFPGFERVLVLTGGTGLRLRHGAEAAPVLLAPFEPYRFSGDLPTTAELLDGPVRDLNVLARRGRCVAEVRLLPSGPSALRLEPGSALLHVLRGTWSAMLGASLGAPLGLGATAGDAARAFVLQAGESLLVEDLDAPCGIDLVGVAGARALWVGLSRVRR